MSAEPLVRAGTPVRRAVLIVSVVTLSLPLAGCNTKNRISSPDPVIAFAPQSTVTRGLRMQTGSGSVNLTLRIEVVSVFLGDVAHLSYDMTYPADLFRFTGAEEGSYLSEDGDVDTELQLTEPGPGVVLVEHRRRPGSGPLDQELQEGVTATFEFEGYASGEGTFALRNIRAFRSDGSEIEDIDEVEAFVAIDIANAA